jgi:hypothetical protein
VNGPDWAAPVEVSRHALERAGVRLGWSEGPVAGELETRVKVEVRLGLACDRVATIRPDWTRGQLREERDRQPRFFVWDEAASRCWVLCRHGRTLTVMTLLLSYETETAAAAQRRLKPGVRPA